MRSAVHDVLPAGLRRSLSKFGAIRTLRVTKPGPRQTTEGRRFGEEHCWLAPASCWCVWAFLSGYAAYPLLHRQPGGVALETAPADLSTFWQVWQLLDQDFLGAPPAALGDEPSAPSRGWWNRSTIRTRFCRTPDQGVGARRSGRPVWRCGRHDPADIGWVHVASAGGSARSVGGCPGCRHVVTG